MWTTENRARYDRSRLHYPSDLTNAEWDLLALRELWRFSKSARASRRQSTGI